MNVKNRDDAPATKGDLKLVKEDVRLVKEDVRLVQEDVRLVKEDVRLVKEDVQLVKEDVQLVKEDVRLVQEDVRLVKEDVRLVREELQITKTDLKRNISLEIVKTNARIDKLGETIRAEMRTMSSGIHTKIDGFMSRVGTVDRAQIIADWRMTELEKRVSAIEPRPS